MSEIAFSKAGVEALADALRRAVDRLAELDARVAHAHQRADRAGPHAPFADLRAWCDQRVALLTALRDRLEVADHLPLFRMDDWISFAAFDPAAFWDQTDTHPPFAALLDGLGHEALDNRIGVLPLDDDTALMELLAAVLDDTPNPDTAEFVQLAVDHGLIDPAEAMELEQLGFGVLADVLLAGGLSQVSISAVGTTLPRHLSELLDDPVRATAAAATLDEIPAWLRTVSDSKAFKVGGALTTTLGAGVTYYDHIVVEERSHPEAAMRTVGSVGGGVGGGAFAASGCKLLIPTVKPAIACYLIAVPLASGGGAVAGDVTLGWIHGQTMQVVELHHELFDD